MSHAEALQTRHPAAGATEDIVGFVSGLRYAALSDGGAPLCAATPARHRRRDDRRRRRRGRDPRGGGAGGGARRRRVPVPGRARRADLLDAAYLGGTAAHGIELDDGYRHGSVHRGCVVPPVLALGHQRGQSGQR